MIESESMQTCPNPPCFSKELFEYLHANYFTWPQFVDEIILNASITRYSLHFEDSVPAPPIFRLIPKDTERVGHKFLLKPAKR